MRTEKKGTQAYYRLPWSLNDNILGWLEPTKACNLYCEGCYSRNDPKSHKSLEQVRADLDVFRAQRKMDSISIAGGDPLTHPQIVEIVRMITTEYGYKVVLNTNGLALTPELTRDLKSAGLHGFTFHVDSSQGRPHWKDATEEQLNALRSTLAGMVAAVGGLSVAFNCTVFPDTLDQMPVILDWARRHIDIVQTVVFILFRTARSAEFDYYAGATPVPVDADLVYYDQDANPRPLTAQDAIAALRTTEPLYEPCAYLGGTRDPNAFKWLVAGRYSDGKRTFGYAGPRYMEAVQNGHHFATGRYLGYVHPDLQSHGRSMFAGLSLFDQGTRLAAARWAGNAVLPWRAARRVYFQSILIIQPIDMMPDGEASMCDGCPDMTVHEGQLVWSCRLDECKQYGCFVRAVPRPPSAQLEIPR